MNAKRGSLPWRAVRAIALWAALIEMFMLFSPSAWAVPSYTRRYDEPCSTCHTYWGALSGAGTQFKLSGYRAIGGKDLTPVQPDTALGKGGASMPSTFPLSFITGVGLESRSEKREVPSSAISITSKSNSLALEDASLFLTSPVGSHLSAFVEFPMYETRAWEFTPAGNYEARYNAPGGQLKFGVESPAFEVAKFFWNNVFDGTPRDSVNLLGGITHLPLAYSPGKVRLSVNQYLIYERTALGLLSPRKLDDVVGGEPNDALFRLSEPQVIAETFGMLTFDKPVTDVGKRDTFWAEYHVGITNGTNAKAANASVNAVYGRWVMRYFNQSLGFFGYHSGDTYSDGLRSGASLGSNASGIMSGAQEANRTNRLGIDMTLSLVPAGFPFTLENQYMANSESNPTGFNQQFKWKGGFHQLNWLVSKKSIAYARYDWLKGDAFDDTTSTVNSVSGITRSTPKEHDFVLGYQHLVEENIKFVAEFRSHKFEDTASGGVIAALGPLSANQAKLSDNGFTVRMMFGF